MEWRKLCKKLLFPPVWIIIILTVISTAGLVFIFVKGLEQSIAAYIIYVAAFYTLTVLCIFLSLVLPKQYKQIRQKIYDNPLGNRYMTDAEFRTHIWLHLSLAINLLYAAINVLSFILYHSMWFVCLAVYYSILAVMRFLLAKYAHRNGFGRNAQGQHQCGHGAHQVLTGSTDVKQARLKSNRHGQAGHDDRGSAEEHIAPGCGVEAPCQITRGIAAIGKQADEDQADAIPHALDADVFLSKAYDGNHDGTNEQANDDRKQGSQQLSDSVFLQ